MKTSFLSAPSHKTQMIIIASLLIGNISGLTLADKAEKANDAFIKWFNKPEQTYTAQRTPTELEAETARVYSSVNFTMQSKKRAEAIASIILKTKHDQLRSDYTDNATALLKTMDTDLCQVLSAEEALSICGKTK